MIDVQITTPVLPKEKTEKKLVSLVKNIVKDADCKVRFFASGKDSYGQKKFDVLVLDDNREQEDTRNEILNEIFMSLYNNQ